MRLLYIDDGCFHASTAELKSEDGGFVTLNAENICLAFYRLSLPTLLRSRLLTNYILQ